jgi:putative FmdB family regulatory protein
MPSYEYVCRDCKKDFMIFLSLKELEAQPRVICPHCKSDNVEKKLTGFFAKTDRKS